MSTCIFFQSEVIDPYGFYKQMISVSPFVWDEANKLWAVYSYNDCKAILESKAFEIPLINPNNEEGLNEYALLLTKQFARLSNGIEHDLARETAVLMLKNVQLVQVNEVIEKLLIKEGNKNIIDWVDVICKKLPIIVTLKSFGFGAEDSDFIESKIEEFVKIMLPEKTSEQIKVINELSEQIFKLVKKHLLSVNIYQTLIKYFSDKHKLDTEKVVSFFVSNLIGLSIIQGYDANRGLLSNSLFQILNNPKQLMGNFNNKQFFKKSVIETLRFDPPVHNTRRVAVKDIFLKSAAIKKGELILVVLAAANRDPQNFIKPNNYDIDRNNNNENLTFGWGTHTCVANQFAINLATETLFYFFNRFKNISLIEKHIIYEPKVNLRLPRNLLISIS